MKIKRLVMPLVGLSLVITLAAPVSAQLAEWNQERVQQLAKDLQKATQKLYSDFYRRPVSTIGSGQANSYYRLKQILRRLRSETRHFSKSLADGATRQESLPIYESLMVMVRSAREEARRTFIEDDILNTAAVVGDRLRQVAPYYDPKANENPDLKPLKDEKAN